MKRPWMPSCGVRKPHAPLHREDNGSFVACVPVADRQDNKLVGRQIDQVANQFRKFFGVAVIADKDVAPITGRLDIIGGRTSRQAIQ